MADGRRCACRNPAEPVPGERRNMSFTARLSIAMISLVVLTAAAVGVLIYRRATTDALPLALRDLQGRTALIGSDLEAYVEGARADVRALAELQASVAAAGALSPQAGGTAADETADRWRRHLGEAFLAEMGAKTSYLQLRLIGTGGREIVRAERAGPGAAARLVAADALQDKSGRPYFRKTVRLAKGAVYVSPIDYNVEHGALQRPYLPTMRIAASVVSAAGTTLGIVVVNLDMRPILARLPDERTPGSTLYLVDEHGNYLVSPRTSRDFAFERGHRARIQDDWPQLADMLEAPKPGSRRIAGPAGPVAVAGWPVLLAGSRRVTVFETIPVPALLAANGLVASSSIVIGIVAAALAALVGVLLGISFARPVHAITLAVTAAADGGAARLPTDASGEVGKLAHAIGRYMQREVLLGAIISSSPDAILTKDLDGTITSWNPAAEALYGYSAAEAVGAHLDIIVPPDRRAELEGIMRKVAEGEHVREMLTQRLDKAGIRRDISLTISPLRDHSGRITGATTIACDVTRRLADQKRLQQLQAEAAHAARVNAAGQMAASLAHELNQPLTAVLNYVRSARRIFAAQGFAAEDQALMLVDKAAEQSRRAGAIVRRLGDFIGNQHAQVEMADINRVVEDGIETALMSRPDDESSVERRYGEGLPRLPIDRIQIQQVVVNLVRNGLEAMADSGTRRLTATTRAAGGTVEVAISDTGPGVDANDLPQIFEAFRTSKPKGMGIGLAVSRSIVEAHGGRLAVETGDDGTTFRFTLPAEVLPDGAKPR